MLKSPIIKSLLFFCLFFAENAFATHMAGGDISCEHLSINSYKIRLRIIRDCAGIPIGQTASISVSNGANNSIIPLILNRISVTDVTLLCPGQLSLCASASGLFGSQEIIYEGTVSLPALSGNAFYTISYSECCRNNAITNLQTPGSQLLYLSTTLNPNLTVKNSSPVFLNRPVAYFCNTKPIVISPNAYDKDGDQLRYSLVNPKSDANTNIPYTSGLSVSNPVVASVPITINPNTGEIRFTPSQPQVVVLSILVEEFRAGVKIGSMVHDMQIWIQNCSNTPPVINPITVQTVNVGTNFCIPIQASDVDMGSITLTAVSGLLSQGATFTASSTTAGAASGNFCFTPTAAHAGRTFTITINAQDNQCPISATSAMTFNIVVPGNCPKTGVTFVSTPAACGLNSGTATANLEPIGIAPYSYYWTGPSNFTAYTQTISGLAVGNYSVTVIDAQGCTGQNTISIGRADQVQLLGTVVDATCKTQNGAINVNAFGGTAPYTFSLNGGTPQSSGNFTSLAAGTYTVRAVATGGCNGQATFTVAAVADVVKPTITCPANIVRTLSLSSTTMTIAIGTPVVADNCTGFTVANNAPTSFSVGITPVTWTATDSSGNQNTCVQNIEVKGTTTSTSIKGGK